tara:strand:- start:551 stop:1300 length:750 start_codon:yes stop_codon:yes gene_type:complete
MINLSKYNIVLLSAGVGRRLGSFGKTKPKCLLTINKISLISKIIYKLKKRNAKFISIIVGYKAKLIIEHLKRIKGIKFNFIKITQYRKNGHGYSLYQFKDQWKKEPKPLLMIHTDIIFEDNYLDNIINDKKENIIGIKDVKNHILKKNSFVVKEDNKRILNKIGRCSQIKTPLGEIIGLNKFSSQTTKNLFKFMDKFFRDKKNRLLSWEQVINKYLNFKNDKFYCLKKQYYKWININKMSDYNLAIKNF